MNPIISHERFSGNTTHKILREFGEEYLRRHPDVAEIPDFIVEYDPVTDAQRLTCRVVIGGTAYRKHIWVVDRYETAVNVYHRIEAKIFEIYEQVEKECEDSDG